MSYRTVGNDTGDCQAVPSHKNREVFPVEDLLTKQTLKFCGKCLLNQIRIRHRNGKPEEAFEK